MSSGIKSPIRDLTAQHRPVGAGAADLRKLWIGCGHKAHSGQKRGAVLWKCAACVGAKA